MGARLVAFALLVCAAFAWVPPYLDRVGTAALGFAFVALVVGRGAVAPRPTLPRVRPPAQFDGLPLEPTPSAIVERMRAYSAAATNGGDDV